MLYLFDNKHNIDRAKHCDTIYSNTKTHKIGAKTYDA